MNDTDSLPVRCCPEPQDTPEDITVTESSRKRCRTDEEYKQLIARLNRIEGQIRGIRRMLERDAYCPDILIQVSAANAALDSFTRELLSQHISTCVVQDLKDEKEGTVDELLWILQKLMK